MRDIKRDSLIDATDILLFDIRELLQKLCSNESKTIVPEIIIDSEAGLPCKYCGGSHEKPQQISACAKKNRKDVNIDV